MTSNTFHCINYAVNIFMTYKSVFFSFRNTAKKDSYSKVGLVFYIYSIYISDFLVFNHLGLKILTFHSGFYFIFAKVIRDLLTVARISLPDGVVTC